MTSNGRWSVILRYVADSDWPVDSYMLLYRPVRDSAASLGDMVARHLDADAHSYGVDWGSDE